MVKLKELINKSVYGVIGYIGCNDDLESLEQRILYNLPILKEYKQIVVATNYSDSEELIEKNNNLWEKYFPNVYLITSPVNRGHNFGTADLDNLIFDWCKYRNEEWLCKSAIDIILDKDILNKEIEESDFYYLNGIGFGGMEKYNYDFEKIIKEDFYPQTNFYFINVSKTDYLNDKKYLDNTYDFIKTIKNYNGKVWEYIKNWTCERFLRKCVERNNLSKYHLVPQDSYRNLLSTIYYNQIHDCSHKNILINGICHFHYPDDKIFKI